MGAKDGGFWRLGHAGELRFADRRTPPGAQRCRHVRRVPHARGGCEGRRSAPPSCVTCWPTMPDKITVPGKALYSAMLRPDGHVIDDLIIIFMTEQWFRIVVNAGTADKDIAWMKLKAAEFKDPHPSLSRLRERDKTHHYHVSRRLGDGRHPGPQCARQGVWQVLPQTKGSNRELGEFPGCRLRRIFRGTHRLYR